MSFPKYPEYKDSGVEWLGEVPAHWVVGPLRWYATIQGGVAKGKNYSDDTPTIDLPYLRVANVQDGHVDLSSVNTVTVALSEVDRYRLQPGDVLMNEGGDNDKLGRGTVWEGEIADCLHQNHVFAIRPNQHLLPYWLSMFTRSSAARSYFYLYSKQSTNLASISSSNVMSCPLPLPPQEEQRQVLSFLDHETARIDALVEQQQRLIELLKEKRQAVISHAVTKGLDPDVPMKDSGVEWLGEVPAHWDIVALRWFIRCSSGEAISRDQIFNDPDQGSFPVAGGNGVIGFSESHNVAPGSIVIGRVGALCGNVHLIHEPAWVTDNALWLEIDKTRLSSKYLKHFLLARGLNDLASKTAQPLLTSSQIKDQIVAIPPIHEQVEIGVWLEAELLKNDSLVEQVKEGIELLSERRSALISAAVTGKIDVRGWQPPAGSSVPARDMQTEAV